MRFCEKKKKNLGLILDENITRTYIDVPGYKQDIYFTGKKKLVLILDKNTLNPYRTRILHKIKYLRFLQKNFTQNIEVKYTNSKDILWGKKTRFNFVQKCHRPRILFEIRCLRFCSKTCTLHFWKSLIQIANL